MAGRVKRRRLKVRRVSQPRSGAEQEERAGARNAWEGRSGSQDSYLIKPRRPQAADTAGSKVRRMRIRVEDKCFHEWGETTV